MGDWQQIALVIAGGLAGGFVNGMTGFGTALTGLPFWLNAVDPALAAQLGAACSIVGQVSTLRAIWHAIDWWRLAPMLIAGLIGVPIGTLFVPYLTIATFKLAVGLILVLYCGFMLLAAGRIRLRFGEQGAEAGVGFAGGIMAGVAGLSGVPPTIWASLKGWPKERRRSVFQAFNLTILTAMLVSSFAHGLIGHEFLVSAALALPAALVGVWLGHRTYLWLDDRRFDRIVLVLLMLSGISLIWFNH
ncbi:MAG: sulfite exporter TauE/SafE family protein [Pseudorhodoplanes sp.]